MNKTLIAMMAFTLWLAPALSMASQTADEHKIQALEHRIAEQDRLIQDLLVRIQALETARVAAAPAANPVSSKNPVTLFGDFRFRHETIDQRNAKQRNRHRIRLRVGLDARLSGDTAIGFQLSSGTGDPVSTNQTLDDAFSGKQINIDTAYASHRFGNSTLIAGKMANPFVTPGKSELIWDSDLNPEGLAMTYRDETETTAAFANLGGFWMDERSGSADAALWGAQTGYSWKNAHAGSHITLGMAYFDFIHTRGQNTFVDPADSFGNSVTAAGRYATDFNELDVFAQYGFRLKNHSAHVFADYVSNTAAGSDDTGWLAGVREDTKAHHGMSWRAIYRRVEKDAMPGALTDSDFGGGGTDSKGLELGLDYNVTPAAKASLTCFLNKQGLSAGSNYNRMQLDYSFKF